MGEAIDHWVRVASIEDIPDDGVKPVRTGGEDIALYKVAGEIFATDNICTHEQAYLSDGYLEGCVIECPLHQGQFDIRTGKAMCKPVTEDLRTFPVKIVGADIYLKLRND